MVAGGDARRPPSTSVRAGHRLGQVRPQEKWFAKAINTGTTIEPVEIGAHDGYWLNGDPHLFFWEGEDGFVDDDRRWVGDALVWSDGEITHRLETSLGRDQAIRIAESMR